MKRNVSGALTLNRPFSFGKALRFIFLLCCCMAPQTSTLAQIGSSSDNLSGEVIIEVIKASIITCNITQAEGYLLQLNQHSSALQQQSPRLEKALQVRIGKMNRHRSNLNKLAEITRNGETDEIKHALRASMTTINCPEDRMRLIEIVKRIQTALKQEASDNQRAMERAINQGQYAQDEKLRKRRVIGQTILLLVGAMDFDGASFSVPDIDKDQYLNDLATLGIQNMHRPSIPMPLGASKHGYDQRPRTICTIKDLSSGNDVSGDGGIYYIDVSSEAPDGHQRIVYKIQAAKSTMVKAADLGPYRSLDVAKQVADRICPVDRRFTN